MSFVSKYALNSAHVTSRAPILKGASFPGAPGTATRSNDSEVPGIDTFSAGCCGTAPSRATTTEAISTRIDGLLSLGGSDPGHLRSHLLYVEQTGLGMR